MRTLCMWFPAWPLGDAPPDSPLIVVAAPEGGVSRVVAASVDEIRAGMSRREAEGRCPGADVRLRDLGDEARRFEPVVTAVEEVVPRVEVTEPGTLFVPLGGAVGYYGGESEVIEALVGKVRAAAPDTDLRVGVADGPFAASWAARTARNAEANVIDDTRAFLSSLDVASLSEGVTDRTEVESLVATFRWLGVTTLGELARLPREAVASRFGPSGLDAHRLAIGEDRQVDPRRIPPELAVDSEFEDPIESADRVAFAARALSARLMVGLRREGIAPHRVTITVEAADGTRRTRVWRSSAPLGEPALADRVWWQLRAWIESSGIPGGIVRIRLDPSDLSGDGRQLALFEDEAARVEAERALARAQALLGPDAVVHPVRQGGRTPEERVGWTRWGEEGTDVARDPDAPWPGATPGPAPALLPSPPPRLEVEWDEGIPSRVRLGARWEPVLTWSGPWRLTGSWWRGEPPADRFQLVTSAGAFLCLVREGVTYLTGIYD